MNLYLVRHGQSFNNTLPDGEGRVADPPLTEKGEQQAPLVAQFLASGEGKDPYRSEGPAAGFGITKLYTSAHLRCLQTSEPIAEALDLDPEIWVDVHEECGIWMDGHDTMPGLNRSDISARFPRVSIPPEIDERGWWNRPKETESQWLARAQRVADQLWQDHADSDDNIAIVAHGGFIKDLVGALLVGGPLAHGLVSACNGSITHFAFNEGALVVGYINRVDHLPADLVT